MANIIPKRGDIWVVALDPTQGSEIKKTRPCLVVSRTEFNEVADTVTIIPLTSGDVRYPGWEIAISDPKSGLDQPSRLLLQQIRVATKRRFQKRIGCAPKTMWKVLQEKLLFYLGFEDE